ncbi:MAG: type II toxin-antitoxin system HicA family toxin [Candidatus Caldarchaeum sp.]
MKVREVIELLKQDGWKQVRMKGSHRQFKHPRKRGIVTIAGNLNDELAPGTLSSILRQAQIEIPRPKKKGA